LPSEITIRLRNDISDLEQLSEAVSRFCRDAGLPDELGLDLQLALEELFANSVMHGKSVDPGGIVVRLELKGDQVEAELEDGGVEFNPLHQPDPEIGGNVLDRPVGGLGVYLVRKLMDQLEYRREGGRNHTVVKKLIRRGSR
jgi:anti-sigma regulatory factor (Ser/Thr protein kinase)